MAWDRVDVSFSGQRHGKLDGRNEETQKKNLKSALLAESHEDIGGKNFGA